MNLVSYSGFSGSHLGSEIPFNSDEKSGKVGRTFLEFDF